MFLRGIFKIIRQITSTKQCLRILQLSTPTTKTEIKKRYLLMAKKYHPDSIQPNKSQSENVKSKQKIAQITKLKKQFQEKFVTINQAYQYLKELNEEQINCLKNQTSNKSQQTNQYENNQKQRKMSTEQMKRQQSYQYFNSKFKEDISGLNDENNFQKQKKTLFQLVPELWIGFLLLAVMLGDVTYRILKRDQKIKEQVQRNNAINQRIDENVFRNTFKSMNHESFFNKKSNNKQK